jgi:DNA gyrase/topoisomerase IV subunit B
MENFKILNRNVKPTVEQLQNYNKARNHVRSTNLRFGKIVMLTDADLDG